MGRSHNLVVVSDLVVVGSAGRRGRRDAGAAGRRGEDWWVSQVGLALQMVGRVVLSGAKDAADELELLCSLWGPWA